MGGSVINGAYIPCQVFAFCGYRILKIFVTYDFYGYVSPAFQYTIHCRNAAASAAAAGVRQGFQGGNMQGNQVDTHTPSSWPDTLAVTAPSRPEGPAVTHLRGRDTGHLFTAVISATGAALLS